MSEIDTVFQKLKQSKKYKYLCDDTLYRISHWAVQRFHSKEAVKAARNKLHQVYGAFFAKINPLKMQKLLKQISADPDAETLKSIAVKIMQSHTSTSERIPFMKQFYSDLFKRIGKPKKIFDAACGLNPFSIPWMDLQPDTEYYACDIDTQLIKAVNIFFGCLSSSYRAECADILVSIPGFTGDVVFLLKTLPCLEQQQKGISEKLLTSLKASYVVISFPSATLCGKAKGMGNYYDTFALKLINSLNFNYIKLEYPNELFYVIPLGEAHSVTSHRRRIRTI
jgi:16S rRNA (guanine(1405)-N(7))-methyltransferase